MNTNIGRALATVIFALHTVFAMAAFAPRAHAQGGVPLWTNRYDGPGRGDDAALAIAVDSNGNAFVTGFSRAPNGPSSYTTIKYSNSGVPLWTNRDLAGSAGSVAVDSGGRAFVTGNATIDGRSLDYGTIAYSSGGQPVWTNFYNGSSNLNDNAVAVAVDPTGNVVVTGYSLVSTACYCARHATIKYSGTGMPLWTNLYDGPGASAWPRAITADSSGDLIVIGSDGLGFVTIKYSSGGVPMWTNRYNGNNWGEAAALAVDSKGNVFVTGFSTGPNGGNSSIDYATVGYSSMGVPLWTNRFNGPTDQDDRAVAVVVDSRGNVVVTGNTATTDTSFPPVTDFATIKYSGAGVPLWTNLYNGPGNGVDYVTALAVDSNGTVFVTGSSDITGLGTSFGFATVAYSSAGLPLWTNRYDDVAPRVTRVSLIDGARAMAVDRTGNVFVTGLATATNGFIDSLTIKYSPTVVPIHLAIERDSSGGLFILYTGAPDVTYRLQRAASVTGTWLDISTNTAPASGLIEYYDPSPLPGQAFYRTVQP